VAEQLGRQVNGSSLATAALLLGRRGLPGVAGTGTGNPRRRDVGWAEQSGAGTVGEFQAQQCQGRSGSMRLAVECWVE
jgi:hypothetical protein